MRDNAWCSHTEFDGLAEDTPHKAWGGEFRQYAFSGHQKPSSGLIKESCKPMTSSFFGDMCRSGTDRLRRLDGLSKSQGDNLPAKSRDYSLTDSPAVTRKRKRKPDGLESDCSDSSLDAGPNVTPVPANMLKKLTKGVRQPCKQPLVTTRQSSPVVESTEPQRSAMRMQIDKNKDYGAKLPSLSEVGNELEEDYADDALQQCFEISERLKQAIRTETQHGDASVEGRKGLADMSTLREACGENAKFAKAYQMVGVNFLLLMVREGVEGSILADEMGLGKTAQTILFLGCLRKIYNDPGPHIVVCPASLLENWQRELKQWCPRLNVVVYYGPNRAQTRHDLDAQRSQAEETVQGEPSIDLTGSDNEAGSQDADDSSPGQRQADRGTSNVAASQAPFDVLLTCYNLFERDSLEQRLDRSFLKKWDWSHIILDEAHAVKNSNASRTKRLNLLAERCQRRVMLTGTPLQNDLDELQNLLRFLMPKLFTAHDAEDLAKAQNEKTIERLAERMKNLLKPFVLRRLKSEVASQLEAKQHKLYSLGMTQSQAHTYQSTVSQLRKEASPGLNEDVSKGGLQKATNGTRKKPLQKLDQKKLGNAFVALRKIALHPLLTRQIVSDDRLSELAALAHRRCVFGDGAPLQKVKEELQGYSDFQIHTLAEEQGSAFSSYLLPDRHIFDSVKCRMLAKILPELKAKGSRPLIFSQWTMVLDILEKLLQILGLPYCRLDGGTAVADRLSTVDLFNNESNGVFAFLLSSRAGGQGLNLTGADTVILHDVDFNPQIDRQAEDRCHRLGQLKPVTVIRLVTADTVDAGIYALAQKKLQLDAAVLDGLAASSKQSKAMENAAMSEILQDVLTGTNASGNDPFASSSHGSVEHIAELPDPTPELLDCTPPSPSNTVTKAQKTSTPSKGKAGDSSPRSKEAVLQEETKATPSQGKAKGPKHKAKAKQSADRNKKDSKSKPKSSPSGVSSVIDLSPSTATKTKKKTQRTPKSVSTKRK